MKEIKAQLRYLRMTPRKVRLVARSLQGKLVGDADRALRFLAKRSAEPVRKLLRSAVANARHNFNLDGDHLMIQSIRVDQGPVYKRFMPRARGTAAPIRKRTSHITLVLKELPQKSKPKGV